jgi:hypothetical protein
MVSLVHVFWSLLLCQTFSIAVIGICAQLLSSLLIIMLFVFTLPLTYFQPDSTCTMFRRLFPFLLLCFVGSSFPVLHLMFKSSFLKPFHFSIGIFKYVRSFSLCKDKWIVTIWISFDTLVPLAVLEVCASLWSWTMHVLSEGYSMKLMF